jgi:hypothetical protein
MKILRIQGNSLGLRGRVEGPRPRPHRSNAEMPLRSSRKFALTDAEARFIVEL